MAKPVVLAIDDEPNNLLIVERPLKKAGYDLLTAESGAQGLKILSESHVDVILLDWMMPVMSGIDTLAKIKEREEWRMIPVIMLTARSAPDDISAGLSNGANDYIKKPFDRIELLARLSAAVRERRLSSMLELSNERLSQSNEELDKRNKFIRTAFGRYMSDEVVDTLLESADGLSLGGKKRRVTVMMTDLRGFSAIAEKLSPEKVLEMLNNYFEVMTEIISRHFGVIIDFIGDGMMILFGAPVIRDDDARRAVNCALEMQKAMELVNEKNRGEGLPQLEMGIGINTGDVVAGNIGSSKRSKYGVVGSNVNLASRIEGCTIGGQILVSTPTLYDTGTGVATGAKTVVALKGMNYPVTVHEVIGVKGGLYIHTSETDHDLASLADPCPVLLSVIKNKVSSEEPIRGEILKLSKKRAVLHADMVIHPLSDLRFELVNEADKERKEYFYGKTLGHYEDKPHLYLVHFTQAPDNVEAYFAKLAV